MTVSVLVPFNEDGAERSRNWKWIRARYEKLHPDWEILVGTDTGARWSKGRAVADAASRATGDRYVVADADLFVEAAILEQAVSLASDDRWVIPHGQVYRINKPATEIMLEREAPDASREPGPGQRDRIPYEGTRGGGLVVLTRATYESVGPPDPRFEGWGGEDAAWGMALDTLVGWAPRLKAPLWHLWHPPQPTRHKPYPETIDLDARYKAAFGVPRLMRAVIEDREPDPPVPLDAPARFRSNRTEQLVHLGERRAKFHGGWFETHDPDIAAALRFVPSVQEVV